MAPVRLGADGPARRAAARPGELALAPVRLAHPRRARPRLWSRPPPRAAARPGVPAPSCLAPPPGHSTPAPARGNPPLPAAAPARPPQPRPSRGLPPARPDHGIPPGAARSAPGASPLPAHGVPGATPSLLAAHASRPARDSAPAWLVCGACIVTCSRSTPGVAPLLAQRARCFGAVHRALGATRSALPCM
eukprot:XP_020404505.1 uncharacterized protein LOC109944223 [Zea mays]